MKFVIGGLVVLLLIAHQDYWNWYDETMVFDLIPVGLFYHVVISLLAAVLWLFNVTFAWPVGYRSQTSPSSSSQHHPPAIAETVSEGLTGKPQRPEGVSSHE